MNIEIICIGTELLRGFVNTNNAYLGEELEKLGFPVTCETSVGDNKENIENAFRYSLGRADIVIATGGLGPTFDDVTKESVARALEKQLVYNENVMCDIRMYCADKGIECTDNAKRMAYGIEGSKVLRNKYGTAPGFLYEGLFEGKNKVVVLLPGPPFEMKPMFEEHVVPFFCKKGGLRIVKRVVFKTAGISESQVEELIRPVVEIKQKLDGGEKVFTILANPEGVRIRVTLHGSDELLLDSLIGKVKKELTDLLGDHVFGKDDETLESVVGMMLCEQKETLAVAESCTGGLLSSRITDVSGSSVYFLEGIVAYGNEAKIRHLDVKNETISKYGAVSQNVAQEMAKGIRLKSGSTYGLAVTGIAGPRGGTKEKPIGLVFIALSDKREEVVWRHVFKGDRATVKMLTVTTALDHLRRHLLKKTFGRRL